MIGIACVHPCIHPQIMDDECSTSVSPDFTSYREPPVDFLIDGTTMIDSQVAMPKLARWGAQPKMED